MSEVKATVKGRFVGGGLFEARDDNGRMKHSACIVLGDGEDRKIKTIIDNAIAEKWGNKKPAGLQDWGVREGDDPEFEASFGQLFINPKANEKSPPQTVIKRNGVVEAVTEEEKLIYPGCYVAVSVSAYCMEADPAKKMKACVCLNLRAVMFTRNGDPLGDSVNAENEFADFNSEEFEDDDDDLLGGMAA
ncbi:MAG: DUF2815 family protein [Colwellia sp.]|nr:DUF2815 family protein [Colwellia sp.]